MAQFRYETGLPVETVEQAIGRASNFLGRFDYLAQKPVSANREGDHWTVVIDVGLVFRQIVRLEVDSETGEITGFSDEGT